MLGQLGAAVRTFTHAIELRTSSAPDDSTAAFLADAYYRRGICFHLIGEDKMAISDFESAAHLACRRSTSQSVGRLHLRQARRIPTSAACLRRRHRRQRPLHARLLQSRPRLHDARQLQEGDRRLQRRHPPRTGQRRILLQARPRLRTNGRPQKASESFSAAIEFDKNHAGAHRHMADALQNLGRSELATQYRQKADQLAPPKKTRIKLVAARAKCRRCHAVAWA